MLPVEMPKANENLLEATLNQWLVREGQFVQEKQPLCSIITDKATFELPAPAAGQVVRLLAPEHALLPVGYILCALGATGETVPSEYAQRNQTVLERHRGLVRSLAAASAAPAGVSAAGAPAPTLAADAVRATPAARRLAREQRLDLAAISRALKLAGPVSEKDIQTYLARQTGQG